MQYQAEACQLRDELLNSERPPRAYCEREPYQRLLDPTKTAITDGAIAFVFTDGIRVTRAGPGEDWLISYPAVLPAVSAQPALPGVQAILSIPIDAMTTTQKRHLTQAIEHLVLAGVWFDSRNISPGGPLRLYLDHSLAGAQLELQPLRCCQCDRALVSATIYYALLKGFVSKNIYSYAYCCHEHREHGIAIFAREYELVARLEGQPFQLPDTASYQRLHLLLAWLYSAACNGERIDPRIEQEVRTILGRT